VSGWRAATIQGKLSSNVVLQFVCVCVHVCVHVCVGECVVSHRCMRQAVVQCCTARGNGYGHGWVVEWVGVGG